MTGKESAQDRPAPTVAPKHALVLGVFAFSLFLSAFLIFSVEPMAGKMLLPLVGGSPAGWIVAMAFFQIALLCGYFVAHLLNRLPPKIHGAIYIALLGCAVLLLPLDLEAHSAVLDGFSADNKAIGVFLLLSVALGLPFVTLAMAAPTLQRLFIGAGHHNSEDPYFLYAASNAGSLIGLLIYPFCVEPALALDMQAGVWMYIFAGLIPCAVACLFTVARDDGRAEAVAAPDGAGDTPVTAKRRLYWIALAFVPSSLMLGVTSHITMDIVSVPLLWVIPLSIYLLSFIAGFARRNFVPMKALGFIHPFFVLLTIGSIYYFRISPEHWMMLLPLHFGTFIVVAMMNHRALFLDRPHNRHLTEFYLLVAFGGALGGVLNAYIAPLVFDMLLEYPLVMAASLLLNPRVGEKGQKWMLAVFALGLVLLAVHGGFMLTTGDRSSLALRLVLLAGLLLCAVYARYAVIAATLLMTVTVLMLGKHTIIFQDRNFFGLLRVAEQPMYIQGEKYTVRMLNHGTTYHGMQIMDSIFELMPTSYYAHTGPVGNIFQHFKPRSVAVIGLGTGNIACHGAPGRHFTFFEIDPMVVEVAKSHFSHLAGCNGGRNDVVMGDGRIALQNDPRKFDLIVLDAFSSDMVPMHLLTREALQVYMDKLNPGGLVALHLSNNFLDLKKPAAATAESLGLHQLYMFDLRKNVQYEVPSIWLVAGDDDSHIFRLLYEGWQKVENADRYAPWTDQYSSFIEFLRF